ncbi:MAG: glycosyltransferase family 4 protein [Aerococcus sp.]|nr:glycosyltransferase family 4 protein [Aerococcus sp.]
MRILNVLAQLPMKTGSGVYFSNLIEETTKQGHENVIIYGVQEPYQIELPGMHYPVQFSQPHLPFPIAGMSDVMPYESTVYSEMTDAMIDQELEAFRDQLEQVKQNEQIDIVITHHLFFLSALVREIFSKVPVVAFCHGTDLRQIERYPRFKQRLRAIHDLDLILTVSPNETEKIADWFDYPRDQIQLVGGGFNQGLFNRDYPTPPKSPLKVMYTGKMAQAKGVYELAKTFPIVKQTLGDVEYHLIGNTNAKEQETLQTLAGNSPDFHIYDAVDQATMADCLKKAHVFVLPSYYEALGLSAIEAMAMGKYCVTSEIEGLKRELGETVNHSGLIQYTELPRIYNLDQPVAEDIPAYVDRLAKNILIQLEKVRRSETVKDDIFEWIDQKSWRQLAKRIEGLLMLQLEQSK